jgi:hypothetical protein
MKSAKMMVWYGLADSVSALPRAVEFSIVSRGSCLDLLRVCWGRYWSRSVDGLF